MKNILLKISDADFPFFMDLAKRLNCVPIDLDEEEDSKEIILKKFKKSIKNLKNLKKGKLETIPAEDFLNELRNI